MALKVTKSPRASNPVILLHPKMGGGVAGVLVINALVVQKKGVL